MDLWYRVFAALETMPEPAGVDECLVGSGAVERIAWTATAEKWYRAEIVVGGGPPVLLERWLADEEGIRAELNAWAAYLETFEDSPHHQALMERAIQTRQLFTLRRTSDHAEEALAERVCIALSQYLAKVAEGFYQADERGFFAADGTLLVPE